MPDSTAPGRRECREEQIENLSAVLGWYSALRPEEDQHLHGEETEEFGPGLSHGLDRYFETLDERDIAPHPLDEEPDISGVNRIVLEAFWELNGFRDGNGGAIMPETIEWWIRKEQHRLLPIQISDIRDLVPICDAKWRALHFEKMEAEREAQKGG